MRIFLTGNIKKTNFFSILLDVMKTNKSYKHELYYDSKILEDAKSKEHFSLISKNSCLILDYSFDLIICIGGDGSFLSAVRKMGDNQFPILGIHIGNLGFLNQANKNNYKDILKDIFKTKNKLIFHNYSLINASVTKKDNMVNLVALNDIVIKHADILRLIKLDLHLTSINESNYEFSNTYACDGIIISTPLGSTAYSLSSGGPIVLHDINSLIITPISPHSLSARPMIIDDKKEIIVEFPDYEDNINLVADGQDQHLIDSCSSIKIAKSKIKAKFVYSQLMESYFSKLKNKIGFSGTSNKC